MRTCDAKRMAEAELKAHGLDKKGWTFSWMAERTRRRFGQCSYRKKAIQLSPWYVRKNDILLVRDTILHEVAHALVWRCRRRGPRVKSHGAEWKAKCVEIGAVPERLEYNAKGKQPAVKHQSPKWIARCCDCGHIIRRSRLSERAKIWTSRHATCVTLLRWIRLNDPELGSVMLDAGRTVRWETRRSDRTVYDKTRWLDLKEALGLTGHEPAEKRLAANAEWLFARSERLRAKRLVA